MSRTIKGYAEFETDHEDWDFVVAPENKGDCPAHDKYGLEVGHGTCVRHYQTCPHYGGGLIQHDRDMDFGEVAITCKHGEATP